MAPLVGKCLQDISPNGGTADPAADENSTEVVVAGRLSGSIACMVTPATSTESSGLEGGKRTKSTRLVSWMVRSSCTGSQARTFKDVEGIKP